MTLIETDPVAFVRSLFEATVEGLADFGAAEMPHTELRCVRVEGHDWASFGGGWGCRHCPAWLHTPRIGETVEKHPAGPIDLAALAEDMKRRFAPQPVAPATEHDWSTCQNPWHAHPKSDVPLPGLTGPILLEQEPDRAARIIAILLPYIRDDVSISTMLTIAARIEETA